MFMTIDMFLIYHFCLYLEAFFGHPASNSNIVACLRRPGAKYVSCVRAMYVLSMHIDSVYIYAYMNKYIIYVYICIYVYMHICIYMYIRIYVYM